MRPERQGLHRANYERNKYGGYGEDAGFAPSSTMYPKIILSGIERRVKAVI